MVFPFFSGSDLHAQVNGHLLHDPCAPDVAVLVFRPYNGFMNGPVPWEFNMSISLRSALSVPDDVQVRHIDLKRFQQRILSLSEDRVSDRLLPEMFRSARAIQALLEDLTARVEDPGVAVDLLPTHPGDHSLLNGCIQSHADLEMQCTAMGLRSYWVLGRFVSAAAQMLHETDADQGDSLRDYALALVASAIPEDSPAGTLIRMGAQIEKSLAVSRSILTSCFRTPEHLSTIDRLSNADLSERFSRVGEMCRERCDFLKSARADLESFQLPSPLRPSAASGTPALADLIHEHAAALRASGEDLMYGGMLMVCDHGPFLERLTQDEQLFGAFVAAQEHYRDYQKAMFDHHRATWILSSNAMDNGDFPVSSPVGVTADQRRSLN